MKFYHFLLYTSLLHWTYVKVVHSCQEGTGESYRGKVNQTYHGLTCQKWSTQKPHEHKYTAEKREKFGLDDHNYCRNPDGSAGVWCYTTDSEKRWDYCDVPDCDSTFTAPVLGCLKGNDLIRLNDYTLDQCKSACFNILSTIGETTCNSLDYNGGISSCWLATETKDSKPSDYTQPCYHDKDTVIYLERIRTLPSTCSEGKSYGDASDCRKYYQCLNGHPVQKTCDSSKMWSAKHQKCSDDIEANDACTDQDSCQEGTGESYYGKVSQTHRGMNCQKWSSDETHHHIFVEENKFGLGDHNYCRNPDGSAGVWCYTTNLEKRWDYCDVPDCDSTYTAPVLGCLKGNNLKRRNGISLDQCKSECSSNQFGTCNSLDYNAGISTCWLATETQFSKALDYTSPCYHDKNTVVYIEKIDSRYTMPVLGCIKGNNLKRLDDYTLDKCKSDCFSNRYGACNSLDYNGGISSCWLATETKDTKPSDYTQPCYHDKNTVIYLERIESPPGCYSMEKTEFNKDDKIVICYKEEGKSVCDSISYEKFNLFCNPLSQRKPEIHSTEPSEPSKSCGPLGCDNGISVLQNVGIRTVSFRDSGSMFYNGKMKKNFWLMWMKKN